MTESPEALALRIVFGFGQKLGRKAVVDRVEVTLETITRTPSSMLFGSERMCDKLRLAKSSVVL